MIDSNKFLQYGYKRDNEIKGIVIHNTGTDLSARQVFNYLNKSKLSNGCHYLIDYKEIIEVMPLNYSVYHTGKGNDWACKNTIAIEIVSNIDNEKYLIGQQKAIELIKELMKEYNLTTNDLYFHNDFANVYCPSDILRIYGNKQNFIRKEFQL